MAAAVVDSDGILGISSCGLHLKSVTQYVHCKR